MLTDLKPELTFVICNFIQNLPQTEFRGKECIKTVKNLHETALLYGPNAINVTLIIKHSLVDVNNIKMKSFGTIS